MLHAALPISPGTPCLNLAFSSASLPSKRSGGSLSTEVGYGWLTALTSAFAVALPAALEVSYWHRYEVRDVRYLVAISGKADVADIAFL